MASKSFTDEYFMKRCLDLAENGLGKTYPNPIVGAIIVYKNKIIGKGWHEKAGEHHAEIKAISNVKDKSLLPKSTMYVNLEPCAHHGKTPPCVDTIKKFSIPKVVIGSIDPNPKVSGNGVKILQKSGCIVKYGVLKKETDFANRRFLTFYQKKRPYIILKWAKTADDFIAPIDKEKKSRKVFWISNAYSRKIVHKWRSQEAAILVGVQTVINDNPKLTNRHHKGNNPLRLVFDPNNRTPAKSFVIEDKEPTIFFNKEKQMDLINGKKYIIIKPYNIRSFFLFCCANDIQSVIIEGGKTTLEKFIDSGYWDEARVFTSSKKIENGISSPNINKEVSFSKNVKGDQLDFYFN